MTAMSLGVEGAQISTLKLKLRTSQTERLELAASR